MTEQDMRTNNLPPARRPPESMNVPKEKFTYLHIYINLHKIQYNHQEEACHNSYFGTVPK